MNTYPKVRKFASVVALYGLLAGFLFITNPADLPVVLLLIPFLLLFLCLFLTILYGFSLLGLNNPVSAKKRLVLASCFAFLPMILLLLQSINQLTAHDVLIFSVFIATLALYIGRANFTKRR